MEGGYLEAWSEDMLYKSSAHPRQGLPQKHLLHAMQRRCSKANESSNPLSVRNDPVSNVTSQMGRGGVVLGGGCFETVQGPLLQPR